ncbi:MAG TPA: hypothetical protein DCR97_10835, partial [Deltaproteobacteria bacterium]|nr:hypothetical protein [Deltaproteobacteria bacterium]
MKRVSGVRPIALGATISFVLAAFVIGTALSGRIVKAGLEKVSDRLRVERISFGWGTVKGHEVKILDRGREVAQAKLIAFRPSIATFFRKGYTFSRITIEEPSLALTITKDNHIATPFPQGTLGELRGTPLLSVRSLEIKNGILNLNDERSGAPAQLQVFNVQLSIDGFSYPLEDKQSTLHVSGQLSGKVLSGRISSSGMVNPKTGALRLVCAAEGLNALQYGSRKPHLHIEKLSLEVESTGSLPISIKAVRIVHGYYRYSSDQKRQITEAVPGTARGGRPKHAPPTVPVALIEGITLEKGEFVIEDSPGRKAAPEISLVDVALSIDRIPLPFDNTPSSFNLSGHIPGRQNMASLRWSGTAAFGTLETDSQLALHSLDVTALKPYLEKQGDALVVGGTVDVQAHVKVHNRSMNTPVRATIRHLELAPPRGIREQFMGIPRSLLLNSLKTRNNEIQIDFLVSGPIDNPSFSLREDMTKRFAVALSKALGLSAVGAGETV